MSFDEAVLERAAARCRERGIRIPTFAELGDPARIPASIRTGLRSVGMQDVHPLNLYRIGWRNEAVASGGLFGPVNWIEFPSALTRVDARIVGLVGKWFPTGSHKVGAGFGCLVPRLVTGQFDPSAHKAVWPSTGNFCRGGAFDCALLGCAAVAILPEEMSRERFDWLRSLGAEIITTPGGESNVKEIYDACWGIRRSRPDCIVFNQFEEFGNAVWHHHVTGGAAEALFRSLAREGDRLAAFVAATGSAGTLAAGDFLGARHAGLRIVVAEALQCPTLLQCGYGEHRIEGIGDKHVPWIHNVRNTDVVCAVDDAQCLALMRLFNEPEGQDFLAAEGVEPGCIAQLPLLGISGLCNLVAAIKTARHFELSRRDIIVTCLTDSMDLYRSRLLEERSAHGDYGGTLAGRHFARYVEGVGTDHLRELRYTDRKALHHLKYFTWVEQQRRSPRELDRLWDPDFWLETYAQVEAWDRQIVAFNARVGLA